MNEELSSNQSSIDLPKLSLVEPVHKMDTIKEEALNADLGMVLYFFRYGTYFFR